jgi:hypothetical protein
MKSFIIEFIKHPKRVIATFRALANLLETVGDIYEDQKLSAAERGQLMKAMWNVIKVARGT